MKKRIITLGLLLVLMLNLFLTSCLKPKTPDDPDEPQTPGESDGDDEFELSKEKLEGALELALEKIDYALPTFTDKFR